MISSRRAISGRLRLRRTDAVCDDPLRRTLGMLNGMPDVTSIKVSTGTRDALRALASRDGLTLDEQLSVLIRRERRRIMGVQLASEPIAADERQALDASASDVADASR
jgi:hypothetical protein